MGFNPFKSKKKIYVSSVVYNLAGDYPGRPNYLRSTVFGAVMGQENTGSTVSQGIQNSYIKGPAIKYRSWYRYVDKNLSGYIALPSAVIGSSSSVAAADVSAALTVPAGQKAWVQSAIKDDADYMWWAQGYMLEHYPELFNTAWAADFDSATNTVVITMASGTTVRFTAEGFDKNAHYVYALYTLTTDDEIGPVQEGTPQTDLTVEPSHTGYDADSSVDSPVAKTLKTTVNVRKSYSNGDPDYVNETSSNRVVTATPNESVYSKTEYQGQSPDSDSLTSLKTILNISKRAIVTTDVDTKTTTGSETIGGEVVQVTTTTTTTTENISYVFDLRTDTQTITSLALNESRVFIYRLGSGGSLDKYISQGTDFGKFFPVLPLRIDNVSIKRYGPPALYTAVAKAYKKLIGSPFDEMLKSVEDNKNIDDIDYAAINFGVALNTKTDACKRYVYQFWKAMIDYQTSSQSDYLTWKTQALAAASYQNRWNVWKAAQDNPADPLYGTAEPLRATITRPNSSSIRIQADQAWNSWYNIVISWNYVAETAHAGQAWAGARSGQLKLVATKGDPILVDSYLAGIGSDSSDVSDLSDDTLTIFWQVSDTAYRRLDISGAYHKNVVYKGKSVGTSARDALEDKDESGFIVPLHYGILRDTPLIPATQLTAEAGYVTFNCYQVVKTRWYQTGWFKIVLVIIIIVISIWTGGAAAGSVGVLGANAAVGAAIGLAGTAAIVAGAALNALAAMAISAVLMRVSTSIFGAEVGAVVGAIASMVALNVAAGYQASGSVAVNWGDMASASNLLQATQAVQTAYTAHATDKLKDMQQQAQDAENRYYENKEQIDAMTAELMGYTGAVIDPMMLTDAQNFSNESADKFLGRTLMTGSDIATLTHQMISDFVDLSNNLDMIKTL